MCNFSTTNVEYSKLNTVGTSAGILEGHEKTKEERRNRSEKREIEKTRERWRRGRER